MESLDVTLSPSRIWGVNHGLAQRPPNIGIETLVRSHSVKVIGATEDCRERFLALSAERRLKHPAVIAIRQTARSDLFGGPS
jgi:LysR family transcriptional activator of nhaA